MTEEEEVEGGYPRSGKMKVGREKLGEAFLRLCVQGWAELGPPLTLCVRVTLKHFLLQ